MCVTPAVFCHGVNDNFTRAKHVYPMYLLCVQMSMYVLWCTRRLSGKWFGLDEAQLELRMMFVVDIWGQC